jgi:hypothetical protein
MVSRRSLILAGSLWEVVRFFLVITLLSLILQASSGAGQWVVPWLFVGGSGNLMVAAGGILLAAFPAKYAPLLGLLRLGKGLSIFSSVLLVASGSLGKSLRVEVLSAGPVGITAAGLFLLVMILDLLSAAVLFSRQQHDAPSEPPHTLPEYAETEVRDFH